MTYGVTAAISKCKKKKCKQTHIAVIEEALKNCVLEGEDEVCGGHVGYSIKPSLIALFKSETKHEFN